jgi:SAM-dependent methyltransferase
MSFDRLAPFYRMMEAIAAGGKLQRCRLAFLGEIPVPQRILLAGEGHGRFLPECARRFPDAEIVVVDASARMLEIARAKSDSPRVSFIHADALDWQPPPERFDLVVTHFFLDCLTATELAHVVAKFGAAASPRAGWLLADFDHARSGPARWRTRVIVTMLYGFFRVVTGLRARELVSPDRTLENAGFERKARRTYEWGLLKSEWWARE